MPVGQQPGMKMGPKKIANQLIGMNNTFVQLYSMD